MRIKKFMSVLLVMALMFSFCSFFVSAEYVEIIYSKNGEFMAIGGTGTSMADITSTITKSTSTYSGKACTTFRYPASGSYSSRVIIVDYDAVLKVNHNYNLHLFLNSDLPSYTEFAVYLSYVDFDGIIRNSTTLFEYSGKTSDLTNWIEVNVNFTPDNSYISSSSNQVIEIQFINTSQAMSYVRISELIELTDEDDNSSWFEKIINAIKEIPTNFVNGVKSFFENLGNKISELGDSIESFFINLGEDIGEFFTMLKNYILYFEHPVTLNDDGVLVDSSGNPIYTNPFASAMEKVKNTFNGWIDDIDQFVSDMDVSRNNVSSYISQGTSIINDVMSASPVLTACIIFVAGFLVIRKVVGR